MDLGLESPRPGDSRVRIGEHGLAGPDLEGERVVVRGDREHARSLEAHIEESAREHARHAAHQRDVPLERRLEREHIVAVHEDRLIVQLEDRDLLRLVGEIELALPLRLRELRAFAAHRALEELAEAVLEHALAGELDGAEVRDHRAGLRPHVAVEIDLEHALALELEEPVPAIALGAGAHELGERIPTSAGMRRVERRKDMARGRRWWVMHSGKM